MPTNYQIINKETGEKYGNKITKFVFGEDTVTVTVEGTDFQDEIVFQNPNKSGALFNEFFSIREVGVDNIPTIEG